MKEHYFELPVRHKGTELTLKGKLVAYGYLYKFHIQIDGHEYIFEKDEEQHFRVIAAVPQGTDVNQELLATIIDTLRQL